ncbi:hypothetical protein [Verrucosispora sp. WMMD573]|uniref:hypothetical protein n=1 Tax=Verrucosispora sp. WMMD573 TaxID=3015149 RepID=UPI00248B199F|nr:hypothetical protein [Verrucosispora sp. WMMD573]WBB52081.1 hypothetical protein O7601_15795 [Verrucosispora sp. WMMD573]
MASVAAERDGVRRPYRDGRIEPARHTDPSESDPREQPDQLRIWLPLLLALCWMLGTFAFFWLSDLDQQVQNKTQLCVFVFSATALFALGYALQVWRCPPDRLRCLTPTEFTRARKLLVVGASYYIVVSIVAMATLGATGSTSVWSNVRDPATAYLHKLDAYEQGIGQSSGILTLSVLLGVCGTMLAPLLVVYWQRLSWPLRAVGLLGLAFHATYYLFIGTLKGLGDVAVMLGAGLLVVAATARRRRTRTRRGKVLTVAAMIAITFTGYMVFSQAARSTAFGTSDLVKANPAVVNVAGPHVANGIAAMLVYPTHGYLGLAHNLQVPFTWSHGLGSAPAAAVLAEQQFGVDPSAHPNYPQRTQDETAWPADLYWATIYPWLASDLTFPGAALFMGLIGWFFARVWLEAALARRVLPLLIFAQLAILIAYLPANNQLGMSPESVIGMITLLALYLCRPRRRPPVQPVRPAPGRALSAARSQL